jgi:hypothetical protein
MAGDNHRRVMKGRDKDDRGGGGNDRYNPGRIDWLESRRFRFYGILKQCDPQTPHRYRNLALPPQPRPEKGVRRLRQWQRVGVGLPVA